MASIVKRKSKYSVVYDYTDENGKRRQRWETFSTNAEAKKRKKQIEYEQDSGTFFIPTAKTLNDLLDEYMSIYGVNTWAMSTYESRCALPGFVDSKNEEKTERNAGYLVVSHSGGGMLRQGTRKGIRRTPANRGMRAHWVVKGLDISEDVCHGMCP